MTLTCPLCGGTGGPVIFTAVIYAGQRMEKLSGSTGRACRACGGMGVVEMIESQDAKSKAALFPGYSIEQRVKVLMKAGRVSVADMPYVVEQFKAVAMELASECDRLQAEANQRHAASYDPGEGADGAGKCAAMIRSRISGGLACVSCYEPSRDQAITIGSKTSDGFHIERPTCKHHFIVCIDCLPGPTKCPVCGCGEFYT